MSRLRWVLAAALAMAAQGAGCGSSAVGVDDCRDIEEARCAAAAMATPCGLGVDSDNQDACERFARDNCLHGLSAAEAPRRSELDQCLTAIRAAGSCARTKGKLAKDCQGIGSVSPASLTACAIIEDPEQASACHFLIEEPPIATEPTPTPSDSGAD